VLATTCCIATAGVLCDRVVGRGSIGNAPTAAAIRSATSRSSSVCAYSVVWALPPTFGHATKTQLELARRLPYCWLNPFSAAAVVSWYTCAIPVSTRAVSLVVGEFAPFVEVQSMTTGSRRDGASMKAATPAPSSAVDTRFGWPDTNWFASRRRSSLAASRTRSVSTCEGRSLRARGRIKGPVGRTSRRTSMQSSPRRAVNIDTMVICRASPLACCSETSQRNTLSVTELNIVTCVVFVRLACGQPRSSQGSIRRPTDSRNARSWASSFAFAAMSVTP